MRFLKNKIAAARAFQNQDIKEASKPDLIERKDLDKKDTLSTLAQLPTPENKDPKKKASTSSYSSNSSKETKNLVKNYGKAICSFSISSIAKPYLNEFLKSEKIKLSEFIRFAEKSKVKIDGLKHFREILLSRDNDDSNVAACRRIYKKISEIFIKFFSVNWIFNSKIKYKKAHLNFRFKMLRRIKFPELFTYLKDSKYAHVVL